jgi:hypothetical protein
MSETPVPISEVIAELEQYRQRIVDDTLGMAKKVKFSQQKALNTLNNHPEIQRIDEMIADLRSRMGSEDSPVAASQNSQDV